MIYKLIYDKIFLVKKNGVIILTDVVNGTDCIISLESSTGFRVYLEISNKDACVTKTVLNYIIVSWEDIVCRIFSNIVNCKNS